jgi:hypothetical protein
MSFDTLDRRSHPSSLMLKTPRSCSLAGFAPAILVARWFSAAAVATIMEASQECARVRELQGNPRYLGQAPWDRALK